MIEQIFGTCVLLLMGLAALLGISYEAVNVWIFCVIWPLITVAETATILWLWFR